MKEQLPAPLAWADDSRGILWRTANLARRFSASWLCRFAIGCIHPPRFHKPVFVIGVSRSGTGSVVDVLRQSKHLGGMEREGHDIWRTYHHPRWSGWDSDAVGPGQVGRGEQRFVRACLYASGANDRFIDKTPENAFRIEYLRELFPDALFVAVWRNPLDVLNSLINGWRHPLGRFRSYYLPAHLDIPDYGHPHRWCFALIPGWREYTNQPLAEVVYAQWRAYVDELVGSRARLPRDRLFEIRLEDICADPIPLFSELCSGLDLPFDTAMRRRAKEVALDPVNALSAPAKAKWRRDNPREISRLIERVAGVASINGYEIDVDSGEVHLSPHWDFGPIDTGTRRQSWL